MKQTTITLLFVALLLSGCDLDQKPKTNIPYRSGDPIIENDIQLDAFRYGAASSFRKTIGGQYALCTDLMCDCFNATSGYGNNYGSIHCTDDSFTASDNYVAGWWGGQYSAIKDFNVLIDGIEIYEAEGHGSTLSSVSKGEAYFYRAYSYLQLIRAFAKDYEPATADQLPGVPLVLKVDVHGLPSRATVSDVYEQICKDLDSAAVNINSFGEANSLLPTLDAVNALRARVYLDMHRYSEAASIAWSLISAGRYALSSTKAEMVDEFTYDRGREALVRMLLDAGQVSVSELGGISSFKPYTALTHEGTISKICCYKPSYLPSSVLTGLYETEDLRLSSWFDSDDYPIYMNGSIHRENGVKVFVKFIGNPSFNTGSLQAGVQSPKPLMIGEQYLIAAEALHLSGDDSKALDVLNELRRNRGASALTVFSIDDLKDEWCRETAGDGLRMSCLKRWHDGFSSRKAQNEAIDADLVLDGGSFTEKNLGKDSDIWSWPIPDYDRRLNPNLEQNPGYGTDITY